MVFKKSHSDEDKRPVKNCDYRKNEIASPSRHAIACAPAHVCEKAFK